VNRRRNYRIRRPGRNIPLRLLRIFAVTNAAIGHAHAEHDTETVELLLASKLEMVRHHHRRHGAL
jgi:hypothetical protein